MNPMPCHKKFGPSKKLIDQIIQYTVQLADIRDEFGKRETELLSEIARLRNLVNVECEL